MFSRTRPRHDNPSKTLRKPSITTPKNLPSTPILRPDLNSYLTTISFRLLNLRTDPPSRSYGRAPRKSPNSCFQEKTPPVPKPPRPNSDTIVCTANIHAPGKLMTFVTSALLFTLSLGLVQAQTPAQLELFEKNARPLFAEECQPCHSAKLRSGGFDLSSPEGIKEAASIGIFGKAADPENSPILKALSYENRIKMPPQGKLPAETIAAIREWVAAGAPSPAATPSAGNSLAGTGVRPVALRGVITDADKNFWSFKPLSQAAPPTPKQPDWAINPDRPVHSRQPRKERSQTRPASRQNHPAPPRHLRSDRPSSHRKGAARFPGRQVSQGF